MRISPRTFESPRAEAQRRYVAETAPERAHDNLLFQIAAGAGIEVDPRGKGANTHPG